MKWYTIIDGVFLNKTVYTLLRKMTPILNSLNIKGWLILIFQTVNLLRLLMLTQINPAFTKQLTVSGGVGKMRYQT
ncbi:Uncharacterised protein [Raoultella ornithinolytica]|nr:Uncharacterised protein [Raoultella ornithinolytica]